MTSDDWGNLHATERAPGPTERTQSSRLRDLDHLLQQQRLVVVDVAAGAAPGTRRLFLGDRGTGQIRFGVAVAHGEGGEDAVSNEARALAALDERLPACIAPTVPHIREWVVGPGGRRALVLSIVPGLDPSAVPRPATAQTRESLDALVGWLAALWQATSAEPIAVDLGRRPVDHMLSRYRGAANVRPAIGVLLRARGRLAQVKVVSTMTHGCLCTRHVHLGDAGIGVDDWSVARAHADPLRDLGRYAIDLTSQRLPEVVEGRSKFAASVRRGVCTGMEALSVPPRLWRDVLLLAQFEMAFTELQEGDTGRLSLLHRAIQALPTRT